MFEIKILKYNESIYNDKGNCGVWNVGKRNNVHGNNNYGYQQFNSNQYNIGKRSKLKLIIYKKIL